MLSERYWPNQGKLNISITHSHKSKPEGRAEVMADRAIGGRNRRASVLVCLRSASSSAVNQLKFKRYALSLSKSTVRRSRTRTKGFHLSCHFESRCKLMFAPGIREDIAGLLLAVLSKARNDTHNLQDMDIHSVRYATRPGKYSLWCLTCCSTSGTGHRSLLFFLAVAHLCQLLQPKQRKQVSWCTLHAIHSLTLSLTHFSLQFPTH